jgi:phosphatidylinositol alpha-mannosyltransferase
VAASVHWAGRVDWNRPRYYASADIFCTPCQRASFGMVLLEAMSCGRPVVGSLISGFEMLLTSGREGLLVAPPDDPGAFASALGHLLGSPDELQRMGAEGRITATTRYSWTNVAAELETYYLELRGELPALTPERIAREPAPTQV